MNRKHQSISKAAKDAPIRLRASGARGRFSMDGARCVAAYLILLQPLLYFVIPLVGYDEFRLPAREFTFMFTTSVDAWWRLLMVALGVRCGVQLWKGRPQSVQTLKTYLVVHLSSAGVLAALPHLIPFHSFLRTQILLEQSRLFLESLILFIFGCGCLVPWRWSPKSERHAVQSAFRMRGVQICAIASVVAGLFCCVSAHRAAPRDIFEAAWEGQIDAVRRFVVQGVDVNTAGYDGDTPMHLVSTREIAELLTQTESSLVESYWLKPDDLKDVPQLAAKLRARADRTSALLWSKFSPAGRDALTNVTFPPWELPAVLLEELNAILEQDLAADAPAFRSLRLPPLSEGTPARIKNLYLSRYLLENAYPDEIARYQIDARNLLKETPLHLAAFNGRLDVSSFYVERGAYLNARNRHGWTPLDYAMFARGKKRKGHFDEVVSLLVMKGGRANVLQHQWQLNAVTAVQTQR